MNETITCTVKEAIEHMKHLNDNDLVTLTVMNKKDYIIHHETERIKKKKGVQLLNKADSIEYQDNEIFRRLSLYGVLKDKNIIQNILFPQQE